MKTKEEIITKIEDYFRLESEERFNQRNIGFVDALRWVVEDEEESK